MKDNNHCRQCGFGIVQVAWWNAHYYAQRRGFCSSQCEEVYDKIHEIEYRAMREKRVA